MSIERRYGAKFAVVCDVCGDSLPEEYTFEDAVQSRKYEGWRVVREPRTGQWYDACPDCYPKLMRRISLSEFEDIT